MTPEKLKEIVMMDSSATPGPWSRVDNENQHWGLRRVHGPAVRVGGFTIATDLTIEEGWQIESDCNFIAASRTAVPELLAHVADLTTRLAAETEAREMAEIDASRFRDGLRFTEIPITDDDDPAEIVELAILGIRAERNRAVALARQKVDEMAQYPPIVAELQQELATVRERLGRAWAFNAGGEWFDRSHIQVRRAGPAGTYWFLVRNGDAGEGGAWLQRDGSWGGREPQPFPDAEAAFMELAKIRAALKSP